MEGRAGTAWDEAASAANGPAYRPAFLLEAPVRAMTFDNLMPFDCNRTLLAGIRALATAPAPAVRWLFVHGPAGAGKTHLLSACADVAASRKPILVNLVELSLEIRRADRLGRRAALRDALASAELLLLDDVHLAGADRWSQDELLAVLDRRLASGGATAMTGLEPPASLEGLDPQLRSRLSAGAVVGIAIGSEAERFRLLRVLVPGEELPDDVLRYVAEQIRSGVRQLISAALQLRLARLGLGEPITPEIARVVIPMPGDLHPAPTAGGEEAARSIASLPSTRYRQMLADAETREEQVLALEIAISERLRRTSDDDDDSKLRGLKAALVSLREGDVDKALAHLRDSTPGSPSAPPWKNTRTRTREEPTK